MAINLTITNSVIPTINLIVFSTQYSSVNATAVTTITGTAAEIITVYSSSRIIGLGMISNLTGIHTVAQLQI